MAHRRSEVAVQLSEVAASGPGESVFTQSEHTFLSEQLGVDPAQVAARLREEREQQIRARNTGEEKGEENAY